MGGNVPNMYLLGLYKIDNRNAIVWPGSSGRQETRKEEE